MNDFASLEEAVRNYNEMTGENITIADVFKLESLKQQRQEIKEEVKQVATPNDLEQFKYKIEKIVTDFCEFYAPKGRKLKAIFFFEKENKKDTYAEKVQFGDMIEVVLNIDTGTGNIEDE